MSMVKDYDLIEKVVDTLSCLMEGDERPSTTVVILFGKAQGSTRGKDGLF